jgi:transcription antitermination factor NusG
MTVGALGVADAAQWFAVHVRAGREHLTGRHLQARGYEVFLPCYHEWHQWSDRRKAVSRALFTGYVFCRVGPDVLAKLITTPGVIRIVGDGCRPLPVNRGEIETLQRVVAAGLAARPCDCPQSGDAVRVVDGPLRDVQGYFVKATNQHRLIISVSLLNRSVAVEIDSTQVLALSQACRDTDGYSVPVFDGASTAASTNEA